MEGCRHGGGLVKIYAHFRSHIGGKSDFAISISPRITAIICVSQSANHY
jgi:hypothetical protein